MSNQSSPLAQRLSQLRQPRKLSQKELSEQLGITQGSVSRYESGGDYPSLEMLIKLARTLDVTIDYLLGTSNYDTPLWLSRLQGEQESEILSAFRKLPIKAQGRVLGYLHCLQENKA